MPRDIILTFIPLFVAVDAIGVLPIFVSLTSGVETRDKNRIIVQSMITALCLAIVFILVGDAIFRVLGITIGDFMVAGGIILFCIAILDLVTIDKRHRIPIRELGIVPLGTPLIVGPAVLTTSLMLTNQYGFLITLISVVLNVILAGGIFFLSGFLIRILGEAGAKALSKIMNLLLASIAVMMIRKGILVLFPG